MISTGNLSELALDALQRIGMGGTFEVNRFDPDALDELQTAGLIRRHKGERVGLSDEGSRTLATRTADGSLPTRVPYAGINGGAKPATAAAGEAEALKRAHAALDALCVPRAFYGSPLSLDARLHLLHDNLSKSARASLKKRFSLPQYQEP